VILQSEADAFREVVLRPQLGQRQSDRIHPRLTGMRRLKRRLSVAERGLSVPTALCGLRADVRVKLDGVTAPPELHD
jgi:hypothetical protein